VFPPSTGSPAGRRNDNAAACDNFRNGFLQQQLLELQFKQLIKLKLEQLVKFEQVQEEKSPLILIAGQKKGPLKVPFSDRQYC